MHNLELICCIVDFELGSKVLRIAKKHGIISGTIFIGQGTVKNKFLEFLELTNTRKEIIMMISHSENSNNIMEILNSEMHFDKPNHGIIFSFSTENYFGKNKDILKHQDVLKNSNTLSSRMVNKVMYNAIFTVVDRGSAENVIDAANEKGARGGTIINARSSCNEGILFAMPIEPEKELVLIVCEEKTTNSIVENIREKLNIDDDSNNMIFSIDIKNVHGLY